MQSFGAMTASITAAAGGRTSVGKKVAVAATGLIGVGFVFAHMVGNLKVFLGREQIDHYGEWLRTLGEPALPRTTVLWLLRLILIASLVIHVTLVTQLTLQSRRARPIKYEYQDPIRKTPAGRTMRWGGVTILLFLVWHLADFTWGPSNPDFVRGHIYDNMIASFERIPVTVFYLAAMFALGMHLYHGVWSTTQTLGVNQARWDKTIRTAAVGLAVIIAGGFALAPLAVLFGIVE